MAKLAATVPRQDSIRVLGKGMDSEDGLAEGWFGTEGPSHGGRRTADRGHSLPSRLPDSCGQRNLPVFLKYS